MFLFPIFSRAELSEDFLLETTGKFRDPRHRYSHFFSPESSESEVTSGSLAEGQQPLAVGHSVLWGQGAPWPPCLVAEVELRGQWMPALDLGIACFSPSDCAPARPVPLLSEPAAPG